jgi:hypothetical protein
MMVITHLKRSSRPPDHALPPSDKLQGVVAALTVQKDAAEQRLEDLVATLSRLQRDDQERRARDAAGEAERREAQEALKQ